MSASRRPQPTAAIAALALWGCAAPRPREVTTQYPAAPQRARLVYRGLVRGDQDVEAPGFWSRVASLVAGRRAPASFGTPFGLAFDPGGRLLVTDTARRALYLVDRTAGTFVAVSPGGDDAFGLPLGVAADAAGRIYVADGLRGAVHVLSPEGKPLRRLDGGGTLVRPTGVAIDRTRAVLYVADTPRHVVLALSLDGAVLRQLGGRGSGPGQLNFPTFLAVDGAGRVVVNDSMNFRVQVLEPDGRPAASFGKLGNASGDMSRSKGVAVDGRGHVHVADALFDNFQIFDGRGRLLLFVGDHGRGPGQFWLPAGLAIQGPLVAVADSGNGRVQLFEIVTAAEEGEELP